MTKYNNFDESLGESIKFAGPTNYCPVLVGSIAGAIYGSDIVLKSKHLKHRYNKSIVNKEGLARCLSHNLLQNDKKDNNGDETLLDLMIRMSNNAGALWL